MDVILALNPYPVSNGGESSTRSPAGQAPGRSWTIADYRNARSEVHWLRVNLRSDEGNPQGIRATVTIESGQRRRTQVIGTAGFVLFGKALRNVFWAAYCGHCERLAGQVAGRGAARAREPGWRSSDFDTAGNCRRDQLERDRGCQMIISHSRRFPFIKFAKTAGTSPEAALSSFRVGSDVATLLGERELNRDETSNWVHRAVPAGDYPRHDWGITIRDKLGFGLRGGYFKASPHLSDRVLAGAFEFS